VSNNKGSCPYENTYETIGIISWEGISTKEWTIECVIII
jgi:hypothetical protein